MTAVRSLAASILAIALAVPAGAQESRTAHREVAAKWQSAIVNVRVSLKVRMSVGGREVQSMDDTVEAVGTASAITRMLAESTRAAAVIGRRSSRSSSRRRTS